MNLTAFFGLLGALLVLAFVANRQFRRTHVPDVVLLMGVGLLLGPVFHLVDVHQFHRVTEAFGTLAIILILFAAGLELNISETAHHFWGGVVLGLVAYLSSFGAVSAVFYYGLGFDAISSMLVGAVLGCTSGSIVIPVLEQMQLREPVKITLLMEASLGDVLAVLTVKVLLDATQTGASVMTTLLGGFFAKTLVALLLAVLFGVLWSRLLPVLSDQRFWHVLTFAFALLLYAGAETAHASGLIAVLCFGLLIANLPGIDPRMLQAAVGSVALARTLPRASVTSMPAQAVPQAQAQSPSQSPRQAAVLPPPAQPSHSQPQPQASPVNQPPPHHQQILTFHAELAFLVRTFFFVLLGAVVQFGGLRGYLLETVGVLGALMIARWLAVLASRWSWREVAPENRELVFWMMPRGLITAVLAIQVLDARGDVFAFLPALTFAVILVTNLMLVFGALRHRRETAVTEYAPSSFIRLGG